MESTECATHSIVNGNMWILQIWISVEGHATIQWIPICPLWTLSVGISCLGLLPGIIGAKSLHISSEYTLLR